MSDIVFVRICSGTFTMGSAETDPQAEADEKPAHQVTLSEFWLGKTEVTTAQYRRFRPDQKGEDNLPATNVSWTEAKAACESFGGRLPTEAEWEYAARAGRQSAWSFGDDDKLLGEYGVYGEGSTGAPHPVGMKNASAWGLHDMHGNVWEWVEDRYDTYSDAAQSNPRGPMAGETRVVRGGSYFNAAGALRSAFRLRFSPDHRNKTLGFRCVRLFTAAPEPPKKTANQSDAPGL